MKTKIALVIITFIFAASTVFPQNKSILSLADEYARALKKFEARKSRATVESVLRKGQIVAEKYEEMEKLSDADYAKLEEKMRGFVINRQEIVFIEPDLKFYARLAKKRGTKTDAAFFALMREIKPDNVWWSYIEQETDVTGCTIYGKGLITKLYGKTLRFKRTHPKSYVTEIDEEIYEILATFSDNLCACGDRKSVLKEFRLFIKTFPRDKKTPEIKKYLRNIEKRKDFRYNCQSG